MSKFFVLKKITIVVFAGLFCFSLNNIWANDIVAELRVKLDVFESLSANFEQRVISQDLQLLDQLTGRFSLQRPGKFKWDYVGELDLDEKSKAENSPQDEDRQQIVSDGENIYFLMYDLEQVIIRDFTTALNTVPSLVLVSDSSKLSELFEITKNHDQRGVSQYELKPKSIDSSYESLMVNFADDKLLGLRMIDGLGQTTEITFNSIVNNPELPSNEFEIDIPEGFDVIGG